MRFQRSIIIVTNPGPGTKGDIIKALNNIKPPDDNASVQQPFKTNVGKSVLAGKWKPITEFGPK